MAINISLGNYGNDVTYTTFDSLTGGSGTDIITITGQLTSATIDLKGGYDSVFLGNMNNTLTATNIETIIGGSANDTVTLVYNNSSPIETYADMGDGYDKVILSSNTDAAAITLANVEEIGAQYNVDSIVYLTTGMANGRIDMGSHNGAHGYKDTVYLADYANNITFLNTESIMGGNQSDVLTLQGDSYVNIELGNGDDTIFATGYALSGGNIINGGDGYDTLDLSGNGAYTANVTLSSIENLIASDSNNEVAFTDQQVGRVVDLMGGKDTLTTFAGNDWVFGGDGDDSIMTGAGSDILGGGTGADMLTGGAGSDTFVYKSGDGMDTITDFEDGVDQIQILDTGADFSTLVLTDTAAGATISINGDTVLTLTNVLTSQIDSSDFMFA